MSEAKENKHEEEVKIDASHKEESQSTESVDIPEQVSPSENDATQDNETTDSTSAVEDPSVLHEDQDDNTDEETVKSHDDAELTTVEENKGKSEEQSTTDALSQTEVRVSNKTTAADNTLSDKPVAELPQPSTNKSEEPSPDDSNIEEPEYSSFNREELVNEIESLLKSDEIKKSERQANTLKDLFAAQNLQLRQQALNKFIAERGEKDDFDFKDDELTTRFFQAYKVIRERKSNYYKTLNTDLNQNYESKLDVLNRIREFIDSDETQVSFNKIKELQTEWKSIGRVPPQHNRNLWANYHALINRFYDNRSIYFELKELDRKKNMEAKLELCKKAEAVAKEPELKKALKELDELHEEYKHVGPVPKEDQEPLWQRFKAASDTIHDRRREHLEKFKGELNENLKVKQQIVEKVKAFTEFESDSIKEWNKKTKDIQLVQKEWEAAGAMPRDKAKEVNKKFWSHFKTFFAHKSDFFKKLDEKREFNLKKKQQLVEKAHSLKDSTDWQKTANELKRLQREWKEIGPVPEKKREEVYKSFKSACDAFFNSKRESNKEQDDAYEQNLKAKEAVCEKIEGLAAKGEADSDKLYELSEEFSKIGFVPRAAITKIGQRYEKALSSFMDNAKGLDSKQKEDLKLELEVATLKGNPKADRKLDQKQMSIRKKINKLEDDIALWNNNLSFFANSKQADKLKQEYEQKIKEAEAERTQLKSQLNMIENMR